VHLGIAVALSLLLLTIRLPGVFAWQLGWSTTASVNDWGIGSNAEVEGGVNCSQCYTEATTAFYDLVGTWHAVIILDESDGSSVGAEWEYTHSGCTNGYCDTLFTGCGTMSTSTLYTQKVYWVAGTSDWWYSTNSGCSGTGTYSETASSDGVEQSTTYAGSFDMIESNAAASFFASDAAAVNFDSSLEYMTSGGTWYTASNTYVASWDSSAPTGANSVGADYNCSTPWILIDSGWGSPWSVASGYSGPSWICT
jgi:hypothetical protein